MKKVKKEDFIETVRKAFVRALRCKIFNGKKIIFFRGDYYWIACWIMVLNNNCS